MKDEKSTTDWKDLEHLSLDEIKREVTDRKRSLKSLEQNMNSLRSERKEQVHIVRSLRSAITGFESSNLERRNFLDQFHKSRKNAQKQREARDSINKQIPPPSKILEEWLSETYLLLTRIDNDLTSVPMLNPELAAFSRFFEIQEAITKKREAELAHSNYISKLSEMRNISSKLDQNKEVSKAVTSELKSTADINDDGISRKEISRISKRISQIDIQIDEIKGELKRGRSDLHNVEEYSRISSARGTRVSISEIRGIAARGGSLSPEEMGALLKTGGFSSISDPNEVEVGPRKTAPNSRKKVRKFGVSRRGSRKGRMASRREE